jgi:hypothetical protein
VGSAAAFLCIAFSLTANVQAAADSTTTGRVREAASDSTKPILLPAVVISGKRGARPGEVAWVPASARYLYSDDGSKLLLGDLRITSPLPASADLRLYGLPVDQTTRDYVWDHRIGGPKTTVFGSRTKINPDIVRVALHPFLMSHRFRDTNGSLELQPMFHSKRPLALSLSSDAIERRATAWVASGSGESNPRFQLVTGLRQSDVVPLLKAAVPELRVIPRYLDSQTYARLRVGDQTIEGFFLFGRERGYWRETTDGVEGVVVENTRQNLAILRAERLLPHDSKLTAGVSWEGDHVDSERRYGDFLERTRGTSHIVNPRIAYSTRHEAVTVWASQFLVESEPGGSVWRSCIDAGAEARATRGWLTVQPSLAFQRFLGEGTILHGVTAKANTDRATVLVGYGTYADYFVFQDGIFGSVFDPGRAQRPQQAQTSSATDCATRWTLRTSATSRRGQRVAAIAPVQATPADAGGSRRTPPLTVPTASEGCAGPCNRAREGAAPILNTRAGGTSVSRRSLAPGAAAASGIYFGIYFVLMGGGRLPGYCQSRPTGVEPAVARSAYGPKRGGGNCAASTRNCSTSAVSTML